MKYLPFFIALIASTFTNYSYGQACSTTNGTNCVCPDGSQNCELLPDVMISWYYLGFDVPQEFSQTGNGVDDGRLKVSGAIPNLGQGPLRVIATDTFICGLDTIIDPTMRLTQCPDGSEPLHLIMQRMYRKDGDSISYTDRPAGSQSYHLLHRHNHIDDWMSINLRLQDPNEPDTLKWPTIGKSTKVGYCLADFLPCNHAAMNGSCRDNHVYGMGNILTDLSNIPNFGMGGASYSCGATSQGISVGYVDVYNKQTEGMYIDIPPGTCNGMYWITIEIDPKNRYLESNEDNNWTAIPIYLTKQDTPGNPIATITFNGDPVICNGQSIVLTGNAGSSYHWSNGATTQSITVDQPGDYFVEVTNYCGTAISDTVTVYTSNVSAPLIVGDTICRGSSITLSIGALNGYWYNKPNEGNLLATGSSFSINNINNTTTVFVEARDTVNGTSYTCASNRTEVQVYVEHAYITGFDSSYYVTDMPVQVSAANQVGSFSGRGITVDGNGNTYFSPALAGINDSVAISFGYTTSTGCNLDTVIYVSVLDPNATAIASFAYSSLNVHPNPTETSIIITLPISSAENQVLQLYDAAGKQLFEKPLNGNEPSHLIDVSAFAKGVYIIRLNTTYGSKFAKFIKL